MSMKVPITKPYIGEEEIEAVAKVIKSRQIASGPKTQELEAEFAKTTHAKYAIATTNGTTALHSALLAMGIGASDEVITTSFTFIATANSILMSGATPIFADIDAKTFNLDPKSIEKCITPKTKAIMTVNLFGLPCDYENIRKIAKKHGLLIIEDACQSIGATYDGAQSGTLGDIAGFSLYATKNITTGEGGMITTDNETYSKLAKSIRNHGQPEGTRYEYEFLGYNYRMTDMQAVLGTVQLARLDKITKKRQEIASFYSKNLQNLPGVILPSIPDGSTHVFHQYTIRVTSDAKLSRDTLKTKLQDEEIGTGVYYPKPLHKVDHLKDFAKIALPETEKASEEVLSLPIFFEMTLEEQEFVTQNICKLLQ